MDNLATPEQLNNKLVSICKKTNTVKLTLGSFYFGGNKGSKTKYPKVSLNLVMGEGVSRERYSVAYTLTGDYSTSFKQYLETVYEHRADKLGLSDDDLSNAIALSQTDDFAQALINTYRCLAKRLGVDFARVKLSANLITRESKLRYITLRENEHKNNLNVYYYISGTHHNELVRDSVTIDSYKALFYNCAHFCANILMHSVALVGKEREYAAAMYLHLKGEWFEILNKRGLIDVSVEDEKFSQDSFYKYVNYAYAVAYGDYLWSDIGELKSEMIRLMPERKNSSLSGKAQFLANVGKLPEVFTMSELLEQYPQQEGKLEKNRQRHRVNHYVRAMCDVTTKGSRQTYTLKESTFSE